MAYLVGGVGNEDVKGNPVDFDGISEHDFELALLWRSLYTLHMVLSAPEDRYESERSNLRDFGRHTRIELDRDELL